MGLRLDSVKIRIALAILAASLGASALLFGLNAMQRSGAAGHEAEREVSQRRAAVRTALDEEKRLAAALAIGLARTPQVAAAALAGDRLALEAQVKPVYDALVQRFGRVILSTTTSPGIVLSRAHDPAAWGDDVATRRTTVRETYRTGQPVAGLEAGRDNISAYADAPILRPDGTVGAVVDLGLAIGDPLAARLKAASMADVTFFQKRGEALISIGSSQGGRALLDTATLAGALSAPVQADVMIGARRGIAAAEPLMSIDGQVLGVIEIGIDVEDRAALADAADLNALLATLAAAVLALLAGWLMAARLARPLQALALAAQALAGGRTGVAVPGRDRRDEIGEVAKAVEVLRQGTAEAEVLRSAQAETRAAGERERRESTLALAGQVEQSIGAVGEELAQSAAMLQSQAHSLAGSIGIVGQRGAGAALGAEAASGNVQTVAAAAEELSAAIAEITRQVAEAASVARRALERSQAADTTVKSLSESSQRIGDVVRLIGDIAGQTNLLALNATIEAARAGESGKGFAVVASEVKNLASQTARATEEIGAQIATMQGAARGAADAIGGIANVIAEMDHIAGSIAAAVEEQGAATREIARNVQEAATGTDRVTIEVQAVSQATSEAAQAAAGLHELGNELAGQGGALRRELQGLLANLRAA
ncbi:MAG: methyl-accepting chemotaxis sensory transducer [Roseomonas sp.]|nr:methyl-accepting chemotaxis sensory transducer [Roseomonas sp.]